MSIWNDPTLDEQLRAHIATGLSSGMAANEMGLRRNQVVGRASRLGLSFKSMPGKKRKPTGGLRPTSWKPGVTISQKFPYKEAPAIVPQQEVEPLLLTFEELTNNAPLFTECRFVYGDDPKTMLYCGLDTLPGEPWCPGHFRLCCPGKHAVQSAH